MDDTREPRDTRTPVDGTPDTSATSADATPGPATGATHAGTSSTDEAAVDDAVARVRAADPAAGTAPDTDRLHARLAETTGVTLGAGTGATGTAPDDLAAARARRRRPARWLQVAAVAAGVALVGGGGYAVGAAGEDRPAAPPIALQGAGAVTAPEAAAGGDVAKMAMPGWFGGRTVFRGSGLDGAAGTARAWAFDATDAATAATAARVAEVLGVAGEPRLEWGQWTVGTNDGTSATVQVGVDGQAGMWFYDRAWDPSVCAASDGASSSGPADIEPGLPEPGAAGADADLPTITVEPDPAVGAAPAVGLLPAPDAPQEPPPADPSVCDPSSTPTGDAAVATARDLLDRLGVDVADAELTVSDETGVPGLVSVTAAQVVDGTQTGIGWSVQLAGSGVQSVSGPLADLVELGTYDHISADEAVERLNDPRFGASYGGVVPLAARGSGDVTTMMDEPAVAPTDEPTVPPVPAPGDPVAWPVQDVTLTGARLGVTLLSTPTGATLLVPAWELTDADGGTWSVVAVVEDQLDLRAA